MIDGIVRFERFGKDRNKHPYTVKIKKRDFPVFFIYLCLTLCIVLEYWRKVIYIIHHVESISWRNRSRTLERKFGIDSKTRYFLSRED